MRFAAILFILAAVLLAGGPAPAHDTVWPGAKLQALAPEAISFEQRNLYVSDSQRRAIETAIGAPLPAEDLAPSLYFVIARPSPEAPPARTAVIVFIDAVGSGGKIETGLRIGGDGALQDLMVFENDEAEAAVAPAVLAQFRGKTAADPLAIGKDLTAPAGHEATVAGLARGVQRGLVLVTTLFGR